MRRLLLVSITMLALGCGERKDGAATAAQPGAEPSAAPRTATDERPAQPPTSGYAKARRVAIGVLARPIDPSTVHAAIDDWSAADATVRRIGRDARSGEVATLLVAGAAEPQRDTRRADVAEWRAIAAVVVAVVLEDATRERREHAVDRLRAVATLGRDIGDAATVDAAARACAVVARAAQDDAALAAACATLAAEAQPPR